VASLAVFTIVLGDLAFSETELKMFDHYAKRVVADLIVCREPQYSIHFQSDGGEAILACAEKLKIGELLSQYERVLYVDADVLISPNAENIFERYVGSASHLRL